MLQQHAGEKHADTNRHAPGLLRSTAKIVPQGVGKACRQQSDSRLRCLPLLDPPSSCSPEQLFTRTRAHVHTGHPSAFRCIRVRGSCTGAQPAACVLRETCAGRTGGHSTRAHSNVPAALDHYRRESFCLPVCATEAEHSEAWACARKLRRMMQEGRDCL